jgi:hypothetical protein
MIGPAAGLLVWAIITVAVCVVIIGAVVGIVVLILRRVTRD